MMQPDEFVEALRRSCRDSAVKDCVALLTKPPGRKPEPSLVRLSQWFNALAESDRKFVTEAMHEAADATLFGVLCVIDGVRTIETEEEKSEFKLSAVRGTVEYQLSPSETYLHDLLRGEP